MVITSSIKAARRVCWTITTAPSKASSDAHVFSSPQLATSFHMYFHTTFYSSCANVYVCTRRVPFYQFLHPSILAFSALRLTPCSPPLSRSNRLWFHRLTSHYHQPILESLYANPTRHPTPVLACCPKSVYHESQGNFSGIVHLRHYVFQLKLIPVAH